MIQQIDRYGLLRQRFDAKREKLAGPDTEERLHDRLEAYAEPVSFANMILLARSP